jgi:TolB-like protein
MRAAALFLLFAAGLTAAAEPITLAVTDFQPLGVFPDQALAVAEIIRTELVGLPGVRVIERAQLARVMEERSLSAAGMTTGEAAELGALTGADYIAVGSLSALGETYTLAVRLVDVKSSEAVLGETVTVGKTAELPWACRDLAKALAGAVGAESDAVDAEVAEPTTRPPEVVSLDFYRHGDYSSPATVFDVAETEMVVWVLKLAREATGPEEAHEVTVVWTAPDGEVRWEEVRSAVFADGQGSLRVIGGKGYTEPGVWQAGEWNITVKLDGSEAASRDFTVE